MRLGRSLAFGVLALASSCAMPAEQRATKTSSPRTAETSQAIGWSSAVAPIRIRAGHTATLLGTHEVLFAGGGSSPTSTELVQPFTSKVEVGPDLVEARTQHTATMLLSGKVLLAGGGTAGAELYDPLTRTTTATGAMAQKRTLHAAIRLRSGKVLVAGGTTDVSTEIYDPALGTWSAGPDRVGSAFVSAMATLVDGRIVAVGPAVPQTTETFDETTSSWEKVVQGVPQAGGGHSLTRLADGRMFAGWGGGCVAVLGGAESCESYTSVIDANATTTIDGPLFVAGRDNFTSVRTVEGNVLFIGGRPSEDGRAVEQMSDPSAVRMTNDGTLLAPHLGTTATILTGGDVIVGGGTQALLDRRVSPGAWRTAPYLLGHAREKHAATRLHDGRVLVAGGENAIKSGVGSITPALEAELIDAEATKIADTGSVSTAHTFGTLTTMRDGTALLVGGNTAVVERFDGANWRTLPPLSQPRTQHSATILPSGRLLVVGGTAALSASEIFDPATSTWASGPTPANAWKNQGAVLMPNGRVLLVGGGVAEIFDETKSAFRTTTAPGASREGRTAQLLADGRVFVTGGVTLSAEAFDPVTETWSYTGTVADRAAEQPWASLPSGRLVAAGGHRPDDGANAPQRLFDPIAHPTGTFLEIPTAGHVAYWHGVALSGAGAVVSTGGQSAFGGFLADTSNAVSVYSDNANPAFRPMLDDVPAELTVVAGTKVQIRGRGFANGAEASSGAQSSSPVNHPTAVWVSDAGDAVVPSTILDFTDTTATWLVPTTALYGHGQLFVNVAGVFSVGKSVTITPALAATSCQNDAQCKTGFCTDGVCCDRRCDGTCEACSKAAKTSGNDGVCGAVPPGVGRCFLKLGEVCKGGNECGTGFCAQGVCCDSTCDGQCLSCNLQGQAGRCSAINEGACGAACDGDHTLKQIGNDDVDCAPYKCSGPQCNQTCGSARDCVAPTVCSFDGHCVAPALPPAGDDSACGCRVIGSRSPSRAAGVVTLGFLLALVRRRRR